MKDGVVEKIMQDMDILYPEFKKYNVLTEHGLVVRDIKKNDLVVGQYAYVSVTKDQLSEITADNFKEFVSERIDGSGYNWISINLQ